VRDVAVVIGRRCRYSGVMERGKGNDQRKFRKRGAEGHRVLKGGRQKWLGGRWEVEKGDDDRRRPEVF